MDMSDFRPQLHIAQQSRRDKLRIQQDFNFSHQNLGAYANNLPQHYDSADERTGRSGNLCYDPSEVCSEMINFSANPLFKDPEKRGGDAPPPFQSFPRDHPTSFNTSAAAAAAASSDPQFFNTWKSVGLQQPTSDLGAANLSTILNSIHSSVLDVKPNYLEYQELNSPSDMNGASSVYQNTLQELVTSSNVRSFGLEFASLRQKNQSGHFSEFGGSELHLLPDQLRLKNHSDLINRPIDGCGHQWSGGEELDRDLSMVANDHSKVLSLSLSSVPSPKVHEPQIAEKDFQSRDVQDSRNWNHSQNLCTEGRVVGTYALTHRNPGPLGPFTGYSTILRSSRFLRPAQQLLEELCCISLPKTVEICEVSDEVFEDARVSSEGVTDGENATRGGVSSPFVFHGCIETRREAGVTSCSTDAFGSENFQRKAKLLFMQDEVWKRNKQYHEQMQMVVSSFESVAGLNAVTPYVSLALKAISKHFRSLKNAITDQINSIKNSLGKEFSFSPSGGTSGSKGKANVSMLKFFDQSFQKQKGSGSNNMEILEGQHIWRPQRGLPERAVSILRAWLFDHFLHPYPTDTDKHMLAAQTGLTRNQVSNWFINARVRVWKPMVEEIHMLETKGSSDSGKTAAEGCNNEGDGCSVGARMCAKQVEFPGEEADSRADTRVWNQEKRSRVEYNGSLMGLVGPSGAIEMGSVSLTLGLRQSAENGEQRRNPRYYGDIQDFVG